MKVERVRDFWQFGAICQFVAIFGESLQIPEIDVVTLENEVEIADSDGQYLREFRFSLITSLSSNRSINMDNMDDFIRRQYTYRRVSPNPLLKIERIWKESFPEHDNTAENDNESDLGEVEEVEQQTLISFLDLSILDRLSVLHNLCEWHLLSEKFRERVGASTDLQMSLWRIDPIGSDKHDYIYYFLDDGRLYRCSNPVLASDREDSQKSATRKRKRGAKVDSPSKAKKTRDLDDWICIAATYDEWEAAIADFEDPTTSEEEDLLRYLQENALPFIAEIEEQRKAKEALVKARAEKAEADRTKELMRHELLSTRKRSSRIASLDEKREQERQRTEELRKAQEMDAKIQALVEQENKITQVASRTREARAREREAREYLVLKDSSRSSRQNTPLGPSNDPPESAEKGMPGNGSVTMSASDVHWINETAMENAPNTGRAYEQLLVSPPTQFSNGDAQASGIQKMDVDADSQTATGSSLQEQITKADTMSQRIDLPVHSNDGDAKAQLAEPSLQQHVNASDIKNQVVLKDSSHLSRQKSPLGALNVLPEPAQTGTLGNGSVIMNERDLHWINEKAMENAPNTGRDFEQLLVTPATQSSMGNEQGSEIKKMETDTESRSAPDVLLQQQDFRADAEPHLFDLPLQSANKDTIASTQVAKSPLQQEGSEGNAKPQEAEVPWQQETNEDGAIRVASLNSDSTSNNLSHDKLETDGGF